MDVSGLVAAVLGLVLGALLLVLIGRSLRTTFGRPGPSASAMAAYSLSIGRGMLLVTVIQSVGARYLVGLGFTAVFVAGSAVFFLLIDPAVPPAPDTSALLVGLGSLVAMVVLAAVALRQVLHRRALAGVGADIDQQLRTVSAQRIIRALVTACLGLVVAMCTDLSSALTSAPARPGELPQALSTFVFLVQIGCILGALVLYQVGPTGKSMRKAGLLTASAAR